MLISDPDRVNAFANYYVESIYLIEKFFTDYNNAKYRKAIQEDNENTLIVFDSQEIVLKNNILDKMILSYNESAGITASISSNVYININTINSGNKPLHFQKLDL